MLKKFVIFSTAFLLCACAGGQIKQGGGTSRLLKKVNYFEQGHTQAAFKVIGQMNEDYLEGVLRIKKIGEEDYDVMVMTGAAYRLLHAVVSPEGIAFRYLFKEADTAPVRARIEQLLHLLVSDPGTYKNRRNKKGQTVATYEGNGLKTRLIYNEGNDYPAQAQSVTLLNTANLFYEEYAPSNAEGDAQIPHALTYKDGNITLDMRLISLR